MFNENSSLLKLIMSILLFPTFFQEAFIEFAWGAGDQLWVMVGKRMFLLLPVLAAILGCWISIACLLTVLVRHDRRGFVTDMFITWWDLAKSVVYFWGGVFKFIFTFVTATLGFFRITLLGIWSLVSEIILTPFRLLGRAAGNVVGSSVPWIAVVLTLFWCLIEAVIFTYVMTPLVVDTFSNITGTSLAVGVVRIPLFIFLLFIVLGSYAVLATFLEVIDKKSISTALGIGVIEIVVLFVEVIFLYREFVDALVPWFAQYSEDFELGVFWTLAISTFVWFGIRSLSWFLFAAHGTPTIMAVIQGKELKFGKRQARPAQPMWSISSDFMKRVKADMAWIQRASTDLLESFVLPPLQVVAVAINFCALLISGEHVFQIPLQNLDELRGTGTGLEPKVVVEKPSKKKKKKVAKA